MSERKVLLLISLGMFLAAIACGAAFVAAGFDVILMFGAAALLIGAFMAFLIGLTA